MANNRVSFSKSSNDTLLILYAAVRRQIEANQSFSRAVTGPHTKRYVYKLCAEMEGRRMKFEPIAWTGG